MKRTTRCPKCGGADIISDAEVLDHTEGPTRSLEIATYRKPDAVIFRQRQTTTVWAWVCCGCGFVELYAVEPSKLKISSESEQRAEQTDRTTAHG